MKSFAALIWGLAAFAAANPLQDKKCTADNCLRALTVLDSNLRASRPVMASSDCSALMQATTTLTVTPTAATLYETVSTVVSTTTTVFTTGTTVRTILHVLPTFLVPRALETVPAYLSPCSNLARLSSACSCIGITAGISTVISTTTLPTLSTTITTSVTSIFTSIETDTTIVTSTRTISPPPPPPPTVRIFRLVAEGFPIAGQYLHSNFQGSIDFPSFGQEPSTPLLCVWSGPGSHLNCHGVDASIIGTSFSFQVRSDYPSAYKLSCDITDSNEILCTPVSNAGSTQWYACVSDLGIGYVLVQGPHSALSLCQPVRLFAAPPDGF